MKSARISVLVAAVLVVHSAPSFAGDDATTLAAAPTSYTLTVNETPRTDCKVQLRKSYQSGGANDVTVDLSISCQDSTTTSTSYDIVIDDPRGWTATHPSATSPTVLAAPSSDPSCVYTASATLNASTGGSAAYPGMVTADFKRVFRLQATAKCGGIHGMTLDAQFSIGASDYQQTIDTSSSGCGK
jgi:hypothetical protein